MDNGRFQKISIPYHSCLFGIPRAKGGGGGGSLNWKSEGMGGYSLYNWNSEGMGGWGGLDLEFPQGTDKRLYLENAYFMDFKISLQIKHELVTLLTTAEEGYKTSIQ